MTTEPDPEPLLPFLHRDALDAGMTRAMLRHPRWVHPAQGLAVPRTDLQDLHRRCRGLQLVLPRDAVFSHLTAAALRGWWLPVMRSQPPLIATDARGTPHRDRRGIFVRRCCLSPSQRTELDGIRVASAEWTVVELAEHLSLLDLVVVLDSALAAGDVSKSSVAAAIIPHRPGVTRLRRALRLGDHRSESAWESVLRLLHVLAGFEVHPQHVILDADGAFVARADLRLARTRRLPEYDGAHHRDRTQHREDLRREKALIRSAGSATGTPRWRSPPALT
jgi:very-short-patch-repair endonuclease